VTILSEITHVTAWEYALSAVGYLLPDLADAHKAAIWNCIAEKAGVFFAQMDPEFICAFHSTLELFPQLPTGFAIHVLTQFRFLWELSRSEKRSASRASEAARPALRLLMNNAQAWAEIGPLVIETAIEAIESIAYRLQGPLVRTLNAYFEFSVPTPLAAQVAEMELRLVSMRHHATDGLERLAWLLAANREDPEFIAVCQNAIPVLEEYVMDPTIPVPELAQELLAKMEELTG
jgi:hypothetical protein